MPKCQKVRNNMLIFTAYSERGKSLIIKLTFNGFSPSRTYVEINIKGNMSYRSHMLKRGYAKEDNKK